METAKLIVGIVHIVLSVIIIALILLQSGKQAGLPGAVGGAADSFFGKNKSRTMDAMLARLTKICAVGFLITSLFLAYGDAVVNKSTNAGADANATNIELVDDVTESIDPEVVVDENASAEAENPEEAPADENAGAAE